MGGEADDVGNVISKQQGSGVSEVVRGVKRILARCVGIDGNGSIGFGG